MKSIFLIVLICSGCVVARAADGDAFKALGFLEGTWSAITPGGPGAPSVTGWYTFKKELGGHVLARHSSSATCKAPADFDCDHGDLLYVYNESPGKPLKAIYFDNEGHVLHYDVSIPTPTSAVFISEPAGPGPEFRLTYELKDGVMAGKFQMRMPGQADWKSYLEWSGPKK